MILETLEVGPYMANCYIVGSEKTGTGLIIDPGADAPAILKVVKSRVLSIEIVAVTHAHIDHIGAIKPVVDSTGARLEMHRLDYEGPFRQHMNKMVSQFMGGSTEEEFPKPDRLLSDGDIVDIGDLKFTVLHTPGHSPGGICLYGEGVVFTGDTLFNTGIGRTDFPGCSSDDLMRSIRTKLLTLPDNTTVYPGHGPSTTVRYEKEWNPFLHMR
ncbi:MAG: MBL fold metallo-hydrolase [Dehalococcoidia bacterium]|nr:MBL fold metallo-hydrolase [Dehalococcoidia bacterium]